MTAEVHLKSEMQHWYRWNFAMRTAVRLPFVRTFSGLGGLRPFVSIGAVLVIGLLASGATAVAQPKIDSQPSYAVRSTGDAYQEKSLTATLESRELNIKLPIEEGLFPFEIGWTGDFERDGFLDAIVHIGNGSNCCPSEFFLVRYLGDRFFSLANELSISSGWQGYSVIEIEGERVIRVADFDLGVDNTEGREWIEDYALRDGKLVKIATHLNVASMRASQELTSEEVRRAGGKGRLSLDVNGDDALDQIECSYWRRWGSLSCSVELSDGATVVVPACERLGVLPTRSDGWADLVCGHRTVLMYRSGEYRSEHD